MTNPTPPPPDKTAIASSPDERKRLSGGAKTFLILSVVLMLVGLALMGVGAVRGSDEPAPTQAVPQGVHESPGESGPTGIPSLAPIGPGDAPEAGEPTVAPAPPIPGGLEAWSPMVFRLGFSFFVGFAIAYAVRTFVKISVVTIGLLLLALFGLQYANIIEVDWSAMQGYYDRLTVWIGTQTASFKEFITGYLPSTAMGAFGMVMGFRR